MLKGATKTRVVVTAAIAAMWLTACGGGGGGDAGPAPAPAPGAGQGPGGDPGGDPVVPQPLSWTASSLAADQFHWVASNSTGNVMAATTITAAGGRIYLSTDGGVTFTPTTAPAASWISLDMTPSGERMVAVGFGGGIYLSTDTGATWNRIDTGTDRSYESVAISNNGARIVAAVMNGSIYYSSNADTATPTFAAATLVGGGALTASFRAIDSSADGMTVVAASHNGDVYLSTDGGATFAQIPITVEGTAVENGWYRVAISDAGDRIALVGNTDYGTGVPAASRSTGLYVGTLSSGAWTWTRASDISGAYTSVSMSENGSVIAATLSSVGASGGQVILSNNGGAFAPITTPSGEANWRAVALNADASRALLAAGTFMATNGQVYVSSGSLTGQ
jgi:hypothetical protein